MAKREEPRPEMVARMARYLGCSGTHKGPNGELMPCSSHEELMRISDRAEPKKKVDDQKKKKRRRVGRNVPGYEPLGERGVISIDTLPGGGLVSGKSVSDDVFEEYELLELKAENYTKPELRERIKKRIMAGSRGGKPGQWSARKAQLLALEYRRAGGGYRGGKKRTQRSLDKWTREDWTTSDDKPAIREGGTTRYLPRSAWSKLTPAQRAATNRKKKRGSQSGRQFVPNTERARDAGRDARQSEKALLSGRAKPRVGDPDVFPNPDAARLRARSLGCIGISRRETPDGEVVWMPCTNMSDYRRRTGVGPQADRDRRRAERRMVGRLRRELKSAEDCGCADSDLSDYLFGVLGGEEKRLGRAVRKRVGAGRRKPSLRRVAFDANAEDADGDGIVQEGTIHQRVVKPKKPDAKPKKLRRETLTRDFASGGKKKKRKAPVLTQQQRDQMMREAEANRTQRISRVRGIFNDRAERLSKTFGDVETRDQAIQALGKAFPNAQIDLKMEPNLTPSERGMVHSFLDLSLSHPKTASRLSTISDASKPGSDQDELKRMNADAAHTFATLIEVDNGELMIKLSQGITIRDSIQDLAQKSRAMTRRQRKNREKTTGIGYLLSRESEDLSDDDLDEFYGSYIVAHEFAHAWHHSSLRKDLDGKDNVKQVAEYWGMDPNDLQARVDRDLAQARMTRPNDDRDDIINEILFGIMTYYNEQTKRDQGNKYRHAYLRDGLDYNEYIKLMSDTKGISRYAQVSPRESIAESFAVEYLLDGYQNVTRSRSQELNRIFGEMMKNKSAIPDIDINTVKLPKLQKPKNVTFTEYTCPDFHL